MLKSLICLLCVGDAVRINKDSVWLPRGPFQVAHHAIKGIPRQSGPLGTRIVPAIPLGSKSLHSSHGASLPGSRHGPTELRRTLQSKQLLLSAAWPPEGFEVGQTVRDLATNQECVIKRFLGGHEVMTSGQKVIVCRRKEDNVVIWLKPEDVSHKLQRSRAKPFKRGDSVIVIASGRLGRVGMVLSGKVGFEEDGGLGLLHMYDYTELKQAYHRISPMHW